MAFRLHESLANSRYWLKELRFGARAVFRTPGSAITSIATIAIAVGSTATIGSALSTILLRPLPVPAVNLIVAIQGAIPELRLHDTKLAPASVFGLAEHRETFAAVGGFQTIGMNLIRPERAERVIVTRTLGNYFEVFRPSPLAGNLYSADASGDRPNAIVLSERLWERLGGHAQVPIGGTVTLDGQSFEVVGVLPVTIGYPREADAWIPLGYASDWTNDYGGLTLTTVARLREGTGSDQVAKALAIEAARWHEISRMPYVPQLHQSSFAEFDSGTLRPAAISLFVAVVLLLIIASLNVANLQTVRLAGRTTEFGIRSALGGGRSALLRQLFLESAILGGIGGAMGIALAYGLIELLHATLSNSFPVLRQLALDTPTLAIGIVAMLGAIILFGIIPILRISHSDSAKTLTYGHKTGGGKSHTRFLAAASIGQVAIALVLLSLTAVTYKSLERLLAIDPGFRVTGLTAFDVTLPSTSYATPDSRRQFATKLLERLGMAAEIDLVSLATPLPLTPAARGMNSPFSIRGQELPAGAPEYHASTVFISGDYFHLMGIPLLRGRTFSPHETGTPTAAIIDETLAATWFPDTDPIGTVIRQGAELTIVGVVGAVRSKSISSDATPVIYRNYDAEPWPATVSFLVRGRRSTPVPPRIMTDALRTVDPGIAPYDIRPLTELLDAATSIGRMAMFMLGIFATSAVALAIMGVYGVASSSVAQRSHELSVRLAIGATPEMILRLIVRQGGQVAMLGIALGTILYVGIIAGGRNILYGVTTVDFTAILLSSLLLALAVVAATLIPAYRASRASPTLALTSRK